MVDNELSPHGGKIVERIITDKDKAVSMAGGLKKLPLTDPLAREVINITYGVFSPIEGFLIEEDVNNVVDNRTLTNGYVWPIPIVLDVSEERWNKLGLKEDDSLLLTHQGNPLATMKIENVFEFDKVEMARKVYGTDDKKHPGVARYLRYDDLFIGGKVDLINPPIINPPFDKVWYPPRKMREEFSKKGWKTVSAFQTRNVPHRGHEQLMKAAAYFTDGVIVNAVIGEKKIGDYMDEVIVETHSTLGKYYFESNRHMATIVFWDMRYAGPVEAIFHAIIRKNFGCTNHIFGRDHAGVGNYYGRYAAHEIFSEIPDLGIKPMLFKEYWYCPVCEEIAYSDVCPHNEERQQFSGTMIRKLIMEESKPPSTIFRPEVYETVLKAKKQLGTPFVTEHYLKTRTPVWTVPPLES